MEITCKEGVGKKVVFKEEVFRWSGVRLHHGNYVKGRCRKKVVLKEGVLPWPGAVSYTHLTLPTTAEV